MATYSPKDVAEAISLALRTHRMDVVADLLSRFDTDVCVLCATHQADTTTVQGGFILPACRGCVADNDDEDAGD